MDLNDRKLKVLQAVINDFIATAEPVGSRTLTKKYDLGFSPATIRNEMADLEEMGYLTHPHTSAGRIPSEKAYRLYVDQMMGKQELSQEEKVAISEALYSSFNELDKTIEHAAKVLSRITQLTAFAMTPNKEQDIIRYIRLIPVDPRTVVLMIVTDSGKVSNQTLRIEGGYREEALEVLSKAFTYSYQGHTLSEAIKMDIIRDFQADLEVTNLFRRDVAPHLTRTFEDMLNVHLYMDGYANIFSLPEYNDIGRAQTFLDMLNRRDELALALSKRAEGLTITIGDENQHQDMKDYSLITATYHVDGKLVGKLGVIGPTRMRYGRVSSIIEYLTDNLNTAFQISGGNDDNDK